MPSYCTNFWWPTSLKQPVQRVVHKNCQKKWRIIVWPFIMVGTSASNVISPIQTVDILLGVLELVRWRISLLFKLGTYHKLWPAPPLNLPLNLLLTSEDSIQPWLLMWLFSRRTDVFINTREMVVLGYQQLWFKTGEPGWVRERWLIKSVMYILHLIMRSMLYRTRFPFFALNFCPHFVFPRVLNLSMSFAWQMEKASG